MFCVHDAINTRERMTIENVNEETAAAVKELAHHILNLVRTHGMQQEPAISWLSLCVDGKEFAYNEFVLDCAYAFPEATDDEGNRIIDFDISNFTPYNTMLSNRVIATFVPIFNSIYHAKKIDFSASYWVECVWGKFDENNNFITPKECTKETEAENSRTFGYEKWKHFFETHSFENSKGKIKYICYEHDWLEEEVLRMIKFDKKGLYVPTFSPDKKAASKAKEWGAVTFRVVFGDEAEHCEDFVVKARGFNLEFAPKCPMISFPHDSERSPFIRDDDERLMTEFSTYFEPNKFNEFVAYLQDFVDLGIKYGISVEIPNVLSYFSGKTITLAKFVIKDGKVIPEFCCF